VRTSKKICCDPSLHTKNVVFKQEYRGGLQLSLASDFTPTTMIPKEPPLSPPTDIFAIEDLLAPVPFDFGYSATDACSNCPLYQTCSRDDAQRIICANTPSPPQSPLSPEQLRFEDEAQANSTTIVPIVNTAFALPPITLASHPDFGLQPSKQEIPSFSPAQESPTSPSQELILSQLTSQIVSQQILQSQLTTTTPKKLQGCCSFATSPHLPPLLDDICNCQSLVQREMAKINASLETISALMQLQTGPLIPTATFQLPDTTIVDCNDEFAKALGYDGREDLFSTFAVDALTFSTKQMMKKDEEDEETTKTDNKEQKPPLISLLPEKWAPGFLKCASDLQRASLPFVNQIVFTSKTGENKYFTVLLKPCGWFSYVSLLKQHNQLVEGLVVCGE